MFIQTESTPNPATLKFLPGRVVLETGTANYTNIEDAHDSPVAKSLFMHGGVTSVFFGYDFISVTKSEAYEWEIMKPVILGIIMDHYTRGGPIIISGDNQIDATEEFSDEISKQIIELIDTRVRPAVAQDGGDIVFQGFSPFVRALLPSQGLWVEAFLPACAN